jgi:hypothetical protein
MGTSCGFSGENAVASALVCTGGGARTGVPPSAAKLRGTVSHKARGAAAAAAMTCASTAWLPSLSESVLPGLLVKRRLG